MTMRIDAVTLIRNENDIVDVSIRQSKSLFDKHSFIDMQSVDGTREILGHAAAKTPSISVFDFRTKAKYQSEISKLFAQKHVTDGADWVFLLDTDEFLRVDSRKALENELEKFPFDVMYLPWINLIPEHQPKRKKFKKRRSLTY